jgi:hypothetical protein
MSERTILDCDECGKPKAPAQIVTRRTFGYEGADYQIDLCSKHGRDLAALADGLVPYARRVPQAAMNGQAPPTRGRGRGATMRNQRAGTG